MQRVAGGALVGADGLGDLGADAHHRVERGPRVLQDHRDVAAADVAHLGFGFGQQVLAPEANRAAGDAAAGAGQHALQGQRGHRLAATAFADDAEGFAGGDVDAHAIDGLDEAAAGGEFDPEVLDFEEGWGHWGTSHCRPKLCMSKRSQDLTFGPRPRTPSWYSRTGATG